MYLMLTMNDVEKNNSSVSMRELLNRYTRITSNLTLLVFIEVFVEMLNFEKSETVDKAFFLTQSLL